jgi:hypothetical protein
MPLDRERTQIMHAIEELAGFTAGHRDGSLPASARNACSLLITDLLAAVAAGLHSHTVQNRRPSCP